jgi:hypothetical protein
VNSAHGGALDRRSGAQASSTVRIVYDLPTAADVGDVPHHVAAGPVQVLGTRRPGYPEGDAVSGGAWAASNHARQVYPRPVGTSATGVVAMTTAG